MKIATLNTGVAVADHMLAAGLDTVVAQGGHCFLPPAYWQAMLRGHEWLAMSEATTEERT